MASENGKGIGSGEIANGGTDIDPPGDTVATGSDESGTTGGADPAESAAPRKRGRPTGTGKRGGATPRSTVGETKPATKAREKLALDRAQLGKQLVGIHMLLATMVKEPVFMITEPEGKALADNLVDIAEYYGLTASKSVMLWINLGATAAMVYAPKVMSIVKRPKAPKTNTTVPGAPAPTNVMTFG